MGDGQERRKGRAAERAADALARGGVACAASSPAVRHRKQRVRADAHDFVRRFRRTNTPSANAASNPPSRNFPNTAATAATDTRPKPIAVSSRFSPASTAWPGRDFDKNLFMVLLAGISTGVGTSDLASEVDVSAGEATGVVCGQADVHPVVDIAPLWVVIRLVSEDCNGGHECKGADKIWKRQRDVQPSVLNFPLAWTDTRIVGKKVLYFLLSQSQYQLDSPVDAVDSGRSTLLRQVSTCPGRLC